MRRRSTTIISSCPRSWSRGAVMRNALLACDRTLARRRRLGAAASAGQRSAGGNLRLDERGLRAARDQDVGRAWRGVRFRGADQEGLGRLSAGLRFRQCVRPRRARAGWRRRFATRPATPIRPVLDQAEGRRQAQRHQNYRSDPAGRLRCVGAIRYSASRMLPRSRAEAGTTGDHSGAAEPDTRSTGRERILQCLRQVRHRQAVERMADPTDLSIAEAREALAPQGALRRRACARAYRRHRAAPMRRSTPSC